jgi:hypothetical protein
MTGLDPVVHVSLTARVYVEKGVDHWVGPGNDDRQRVGRDGRAGFADPSGPGWLGF